VAAREVSLNLLLADMIRGKDLYTSGEDHTGIKEDEKEDFNCFLRQSSLY
jgi:hypothetical protein